MKQDAFQTEHKAKWDCKQFFFNKSKKKQKKTIQIWYAQKLYKIICLKVLFADHYLKKIK